MANRSIARVRFSLGAKLALFVGVLVLLVSASMAYFLVFQSAADRRQAMERQTSSVARIIGGLRSQGIGGRKVDPMLTRMFVEYAVQMGTNLGFVLFLDADDNLIEGDLNLEILSEAAPLLVAALEGQSETGRLAMVKGWDFGGDFLRPFRIKLSGPDGVTLGVAYLGFSTRAMEEQIKKSLLANLLVTAGAFLLGLLGAFWLAGHFSGPIRLVASSMQKVAAGDLNQSLSVKSSDEVGVLADAFNVMTKGLLERERIRNTFARYVSDQVAERILKEEDELDLAGELRQVTVLFLDIRGFTSLSEHLHPRQVVALLNDYFAIIIDIIFKNEGTINKFIGDSIMAIYGAPQTLDFPELSAVNTAVQIQSAIGEFNWTRMQQGKPVVNFGIGIHSGEAIAGNIGSALRMEYTVIGRDVNLAQRIESSTREGQVLISETTHVKVAGLVEANPKEPVFMKGIVEPIPLYEVIGLRSGAVPAL